MHEVIIGLKESENRCGEIVCDDCIELDLDFRGMVRMASQDDLTVTYVPHTNISYMVVTKLSECAPETRKSACEHFNGRVDKLLGVMAKLP